MRAGLTGSEQGVVMATRALPIYPRDTIELMGRDSAVGIATRYGLDGPRIESRWGRDFLHPSRSPLGPTRSPTQWVAGISRGLINRGVALTTHTIQRRG